VIGRAGQVDDQSVETPCIKICVIDSVTSRCAGCGRTLAEIGEWSRLTDVERRRIMVRLDAERLNALDQKAPRSN
jgi:uncharacterized protein